MQELIPYAYFEGSTGDEKNICHISRVIEVTSPFAGIDARWYINDNEFCLFSYPEFESKPHHYSSPDRYTNTCEHIHRIIKARIALIKEVNTFEELLSFDDISNLPVSEDQKFELSAETHPKREKQKQASIYIRDWRWILYEMMCNEEEKNNHHFSGYSEDQLTDDVILSEVMKFNEALRRVMLGKELDESCYSDFAGLGRLSNYFNSRQRNIDLDKEKEREEISKKVEGLNQMKEYGKRLKK